MVNYAPPVVRVGRAVILATVVVCASLISPMRMAAATDKVPDKAAVYRAELSKKLGWGWLRREWYRQRSYPVLQRAQHLIAEGRPDSAAAEYQNYLADNPSDGLMRFDLLVLDSDLKRFPEVVTLADKLLAAVPGFTPARFYRGNALFALGHNNHAIEDFAAAATSDLVIPQDRTFARDTVASLAAESRDSKRALASLRPLLARWPEDPALLYAKGQALERLKRVDAADAAYLAAVAHSKSTAMRRRALMSDAYLLAGEHQDSQALDRLLKVWAISPGARDVSLMLLDIAPKLGRPDVVSMVRQAMKTGTAPNDQATQRAMAAAHLELGNAELAVKEYDRLARQETNPAEEYRFRRAAGFAAEKSGDLPKAVEEFEHATTINPSPAALRDAVEVDLKADRLDLAVAHLQKLAELTQRQPDWPETMERLATVLEQQGRFGDAYRTLRRLEHQPPDNAALEQRLAILAQKAGNHSGAMVHLQSLASMQPNEATLRALAEAQIAAGEHAAAVSTLERVLKLAGLSDKAKSRYRQMLANVQMASGKPSEAAQSFLNAGNLPAAATAFAQTGHWAEASQVYRKLLQDRHVPRALRAQYANRLCYALIQLGKLRDALTACRTAVGLGEGNTARLRIGDILLKLGQSREAAQTYRAAYDAMPSAKTALSVAFAYQSAGQPGVAIVFLRRALAERESLSGTELAQVESALGYGYSQTMQYDKAAQAFREALAHTPDPVLSLRLARMERLLNRPAKALTLLHTLQASKWPSVEIEAEYWEELAEDNAALGRNHVAQLELTHAIALKPGPSRYFRLSQIALKAGDKTVALSAIRAAVAGDPSNAAYRAALGYRLLEAGYYKEAAQAFEDVLRVEPLYYALNEDLGYLYLKLHENNKAVAQFKKAIDDREYYPADTVPDQQSLERKIFALRRVNQTVDDHWSADAFTNLCLTGSLCSGVHPSIGSIISQNQGGVELNYQPPYIGYDDGRILQAFARTFFSYKPGTVTPESDSVQGGVGVRYKPLRDYNLFVSGERLIKLGSNAENNWLARVSFSTNTGYDIDPVADRWRYGSIYLDLAATVDNPHNQFTYGEIREGVNFRLASDAAVAPFVYSTFRGIFGAGGTDKSLEAGVGASLRYFFDKDKYHAARSVIELIPRVGYTLYDNLGPPGAVVELELVGRY